MKVKENIAPLLRSYLKIGFIGFGGGSALIPVIEEEVVEKHPFLTEEEFTKHTIISNITPGTLPVKLAALTSEKTSVAAAYIYSIPGVFITVLLLTLFSIMGKQAIQYIEFASIGITVFIILLLALYIQKIQRAGRTEGLGKSYLIIMLVTFLLTGGKTVCDFLSLFFNKKVGWSPVFAISTINLMIIAFFVICFLGSSKSKTRLFTAFIVSFVYALSIGKRGVIPAGLHFDIMLPVLMVALVIWSIAKDAMQAKKQSKRSAIIDFKPYIKNIVIFIMIPVLLFVLLLLVCRANPGGHLSEFAGKSALSTATSFGGGEAYISVAEGFFVEKGFINNGTYYSQVVAIANALPGPILLKVVAGIGFVYGNIQYGSAAMGWLLAALGMAIGIGVSSIIALVIQAGFEQLKDAARLKMIRQYILPVICGMLLSTSLSMLNTALKIIQIKAGVSTIALVIGLISLLSLFAAMLLMHKKFQIGDIIVLLLGGGVSLAVLCLI